MAFEIKGVALVMISWFVLDVLFFKFLSKNLNKQLLLQNTVYIVRKNISSTTGGPQILSSN